MNILCLLPLGESPAVLCAAKRAPVLSAPCSDIDLRAIAVWVTGVLPRGCSNASLHTVQWCETSLGVTQPLASHTHSGPGRGRVPQSMSRVTQLVWQQFAGFCSATSIHEQMDFADVRSMISSMLLISTWGDRFSGQKLLPLLFMSWFNIGAPSSKSTWHLKGCLFESI